MNHKRPQSPTQTAQVGVVPSEDFQEDGQETTVWDDEAGDDGQVDSAARPVSASADAPAEVEGAGAGEGAGDGQAQAPTPHSENRAVLLVSDDFEEDLPTLARTDSSSEVPLSGEFDQELAGIARKVEADAAGVVKAGEGPAGLTFSDDFEEDLPTVARSESTPAPGPSEHTQMLGDEELDALALSRDEADADERSRDRAGLLGHSFGGFRVVRKIAEGGMASVYLARKSGPRGFAQHAALKVVHPHFAHQRAFVDMFLDEARIAALISHPSVCRVLDFGQARGTYFLAMEYVHGESWADLVTSMLADPEARKDVAAVAAYVVAQACEGLHAAHESTDESGRPLHVVHRDISPQNIFVAYDGSVRVLDFGIASAADRLTTTRTGTVKGRLAYMAPEQMRAEEVDRRADIWSLGVLLREALEGRRLFRRRTEAESMMAVVSEPIPEWEPGVSHELRAIADRALARDREQRFSDCREMGRALTQYLAAHAAALSSAEVSNWVTNLFSERMAQKRRWLQQPAPEPAASLSSSLPPPATAATAAAVSSHSGTPTDITSGGPGLLEQLEPDAVAPGAPHGPSMGRYAPTLKLDAVQPPQRGGSVWLWLAFVGCLVALLAVGAVFVERSGGPGAQLVRRYLPVLDTRSPADMAPVPTVPAPPSVPASTPGVLVVEYEGGWAEVFVDGDKVGRTPLRHELPSGRVIVELRPFGKTPAVRHPMKFAPGQTQKLRIQSRQD